MIRSAVAIVSGIAVLCFGTRAEEPVPGSFGTHSFQYQISTNLHDPVTLLQKRLDAGKERLEFDAKRGYLPSLLKALGVEPSSQCLVFSKSSCQADDTSPHTPRALYFNNNVSLGWVPDGTDIDLIGIDPQLGPVFYTLNQTSTAVPHFEVRDKCMRCHFGARTTFVPELVVRSFYTAPDGMPLAAAANFVADDSPLEDRWGGWYVTGTHSNAVHLGNLVVPDASKIPTLDRLRGANVTNLQSYLDISRYISPGSDIVALLVLEHQARMQNLLTRASDETRQALEEMGKPRVAGAIGSPDWPKERIAAAGENLLKYMLFREETPLHGTIKGTSDFAEKFEREEPHTVDGRSLRQFDLKSRIFRYPCSFLVYGASFDGLQPEMKEYLWKRLDQILTGEDHTPAYETFSAQDRRAVFEILKETKPEFAAWLNQTQTARASR